MQEPLTTEEARDYGHRAYINGKKRVPIHDSLFYKRVEETLVNGSEATVGSASKLFGAWLDGWDTANLKSNTLK